MSPICLCVRCEDRDGLRRHLEARGNGSRYSLSDPRPSAARLCGAEPAGSLPQTERLATEIVTIPCFTELDEDEIRQVIDAVNSW